MLELVVEKRMEHIKDISIYVQDKLRIQDCNIESELRQKSTGIFMWIVLVVEMLNQAYDNGNIHAVRKMLREVPSDLGEVFRILLEKDNPNISQTILMLLLVLFAKESLKPEEFYYAVLSGSEPDSLGKWDGSIVTHQIIGRFITNGSRGLIEIRDGDIKSVQFIHETVKDFLLRNKRLQTLDSGLAPHVAGVAHQRIASCCLAYIEMEDLMAEPPQNPSTAARDYFDKEYPFLKYATLYVFYHAENSQAGGVGQEKFLQHLQGNPAIFKLLKTMHNIFAYGRYDAKQTFQAKPEYEEYDEDASLLYILSLLHYSKLIRVLLREPRVDVNARGGWHVTALRAAAAAMAYRGDATEEVIQILLDAGAEREISANNEPFSNALRAAVTSNFRDGEKRNNSEIAAVVSMLIGFGADVNAQGGYYYYYGSVLQAAAAAADWHSGNISKIFQVLLDAGADVNARGGAYGNPLQAVAANIADRSHMDCHHAHVESLRAVRNLKGLSLIDWSRTQTIIDPLTERPPPSTNFTWHRSYNAENLVEAKYVIKMMLDAGADVNAQGGYYGNALQAATASAAEQAHMPHQVYDEIVGMLLDAGADVNARGGTYGNALQAAIGCNYQKAPIRLITMLLDAGADVNAQGGFHTNAVNAALIAGRLQRRARAGGDSGALRVLELLLSAGAVGAAEAIQELNG
ncbi:hypothetical protein TWF281_009839 [Arthrobotrys megalospora]